MKKRFIFLMALLAVSLLALAEMSIFVYQKNGEKVEYLAANVDSIGFVDVNAHEWVDLGLPSGTKWATMNVGADSPEDYGDYFAWGETTPKSTYNWSNYKWCNGTSTTLTKYCTSSSVGTVDNKTTLDLSDDAAYVNWGGDWRMPTIEEQDELGNTNYTTWTWTTLNGVKGYKVTSKTNGNSIFLPAACHRYDSGSYDAGSGGSYWGSSLRTFDSRYAFALYFGSSDVGSSYYYRSCGLSVRPVLADVHTITFNANGGTGSMDVICVKEGESITLPTNRFAYAKAEFAGWNTVADGSGTAYTDQSTITPTANMTLYAQWENITSGVADGHEWVDLGLPSGTKWATCNVGADSPEGYGSYFAWGETTPKSTFNWSNYKWCNGTYTTLTKYCTSSSDGTVDNKTTLDLSDDAAYVNWGTSWRMPTKAEQDELRNTSYTTWTWATQNGVNGYKVTSKANGNSIFLPAAGYRDYSDLIDAVSDGNYWTSSLYTNYSANAYYLDSSSDGVRSTYGGRYYGLSVRPILRE